MNAPQLFTALFNHNDRANALILNAAGQISDQQLDRGFDMGMGSLRKTLLHILAGESVWLQRWQKRIETPWPDESEPASVKTITDRFAKTTIERDQFLAKQTPQSLAAIQTYRDSKGSLFTATLSDMILQMAMHSAHHRAQAVNMLRHLQPAVAPPQVDYMMQVRKSVP